MDNPEKISLDDLRKTWIAKSNGACVFISARDLENIQELRDLLYEKVRKIHASRYPYDDFLY